MSMKILLVDDEPGIRKVLSIYLKDAGYDVHTAENGFAAFKMFEFIKPDILLTDIKMPGTDGLDLLKLVKANDIQAEVIMITGHGNLKMAMESLKMDAVDFITKPIDNDALDMALKRAKERITAAKNIQKHTQNFKALIQDGTQKLVTSEHKYFRLFNESPNFITIQDKNYTIIESNKTFKAHFESEPGIKCYEAYKHLKSPCPNCPVKKSFDNGKSHTGKMEVIQENSSALNVFIQTSPLADSEGQVQNVIVTSTDITMIRQL